MVTAEVSCSSVDQNAVIVAQKWQFALARSVNDSVKRGERNPEVIARQAKENTQAQEKKVYEAGRAMGVSEKKLDKSIEQDRQNGLRTYIQDALAGGNRKSPKLREEKGLLVFLNTEKLVANHPQLLEWGFQYSTPTTKKWLLDLPRVTSATDLIEYLRKEPKTVEQNGIWVVVPDYAFSKKDQRLLDDLKEVCKREGIFLFVQSDLEMKWNRLSP